MPTHLRITHAALILCHAYRTGLPPAPLVSYSAQHIANDTFRFNLFWNDTTTWTGLPITSYTLSLVNESSGQYIIDMDAVTVPEYNFTIEGKYCSVFTLSVSANNSLGRGEESVVRIGNPIVGMYIKSTS